MTEEQLHFRTRVGSIIDEYRKSVTQQIIADLKEKGLTAWPVSHFWVDVEGEGDSATFSVKLRRGTSPSHEDRPYYLNGLDLDFAIKLTGTVRKVK